MDGVFPQVVFYIPGPNIPVRDTVISTWLMMAVVIVGVLLLRRWAPSVPEKMIVFLRNLISEVMGDRSPDPYVPFLGSLIVFVAMANILSILPAIPLPGGRMLPIVAPTRDINTPLALALVVFFSVYWFGIKERGLLLYLKDLASPIYLAPLMLVLNIFGQISRTISLTLRLFGNIISGEMVVAVFASLIPFVVPLPLTGLSMITGILQAYIFVSLATVYIAGAVEAGQA